jgi:hypothetical protein
MPQPADEQEGAEDEEEQEELLELNQPSPLRLKAV